MIDFSEHDHAVDWEFATREIYEQWGIDLKAEKSEMQRKLFEAEEVLEKEQDRFPFSSKLFIIIFSFICKIDHQF